MHEIMQEEPRWYAIYTRSRHEKLVADSIARKNLEVFLPSKRVNRRWKDRWKEIDIPLFTGYVFVKSAMPDHKIPILQTKGVVTFVKDHGGPVPIPDEQIEAIRRLVTSGKEFDPYPYVKEGMRITIVRGPLTGVEGVLLQRRKESILVLSVDLIQQSAALQIDIADTDVCA